MVKKKGEPHITTILAALKRQMFCVGEGFYINFNIDLRLKYWLKKSLFLNLEPFIFGPEDPLLDWTTVKRIYVLVQLWTEM